MNDLQDLPVAVLCGGVGAERKVSLVSGESVYKALATAPDGTLRPNVRKVELTGAQEEIAALREVYGGGRGVAFLALHGEWGEDGTVQRELEAQGIVYTGSGAAASALAMNKQAAKRALKAAGLPVADGFMVAKDVSGAPDVTAATTAAVRGRLAQENIPLPVVVKPNGRGSSVGVTIVREEAALGAALAAALKEDQTALVERYVYGAEIAVSVLDGKALPIVELAPKEEFYDYEAKYLTDTTRYYCPARLDAATTAKIQKLAETGWRALGLRDMGRIDFIVGKGQDAGRLICLEANTLPGMTSHSLLPQAAHGAGMDFPALCWKIVALAARRL